MAKGNRQTEEVVLGKKFAGEKFSTVRSVADVEEVEKLNAKYASEPNALPLSVYMANRGHIDPVLVAMMKAHTKVHTASTESFDKIFHSFFSTEPHPDDVEEEEQTEEVQDAQPPVSTEPQSTADEQSNEKEV